MWKRLPNCIQTAVSSTEIREAFKVFDRDGNGFISKQELGMAMRSLGYMPNEVELEVIIQRLDIDGRLLWPSASHVWRLRHPSVALLQVTVRLGSRNSSRCWVPSWVLLGCLTSSTEQILIQFFGRYRMCCVSRPHHPYLLKGLLSHSGRPKRSSFVCWGGEDQEPSSPQCLWLFICCLLSVTCRSWRWMSWRGCSTTLSATTWPWKTSRTSSWRRRTTWTAPSVTWTSTVSSRQQGGIWRLFPARNSNIRFWILPQRAQHNRKNTRVCAKAWFVPSPSRSSSASCSSLLIKCSAEGWSNRGSTRDGMEHRESPNATQTTWSASLFYCTQRHF